LNLFVIIVVAFLVGWLGPNFLNFKANFWVNLLLALLGGILGGWITSLLFGADLVGGFNFWSILFAFLGALLVILIARLFKRKQV
jgi:uncharacterized membrane protein YeaQ/YmgE (transglycosylase-associated protein family)